MAVEPASKRQRVGVEGEYSMSLTVSGSITLEGQSVGELLVDLKGRVFQLEARSKDAEARAERAEVRAERAEASLLKLSDEKADKATVSMEVQKLDDIKADKTAVADRFGLIDVEYKKIEETLDSYGEIIRAEMQKRSAAELERQKAADLENQRVEELEKQRVAELEKQRAVELEKQRAAELEKQRAAELEKQRAAELEKQRMAELEKQQAVELERQRAAELERQKAADLQRQTAAELERQKGEELQKSKAAELEKQQAAELATHQAAELEKQKAAELEKQKAAELERQKAAELERQKAAELEKQKQSSAAQPALEAKSGQEFLAAQIANLSETSKKVFKEIEVALKEDIEFTSSSSELTTKGKRVVKKVFEVLKSRPTMVVCVEGHAGCRCIAGGGQPKRGQKCKAVELSNDRSASVIEQLRSLGCKNEFKSHGHGCIFRVGMAVKVLPAAGQ